MSLPGALGFHRDLPRESLLPDFATETSRFLEVDGVSTHYRDEGQGPPLLLVHGTSSSLHTWDGWAEALCRDFRLLRPDLPGFGLTGPDPHHDYRIDRYVRFVTAFLDVLRVSGPVHLAGNSLGGEIACAVALTQPQRIDRLVLVDAGGYPRSVRWPLALRLGRIPLLGGLLAVWTPRFLVARSARTAYGDPAALPPERVERYFRLLLRRGNRAALLARLRTPAAHVPLAVGRIRAPTLILWGERDRWIPVAYAHRFHADIAGSRLVVYPRAGHVPMEEIPGPTAAEARRFLCGEPAPRPPTS